MIRGAVLVALLAGPAIAQVSHAHSQMQRALFATGDPELIRHGYGCDEGNPYSLCVIYRQRKGDAMIVPLPKSATDNVVAVFLDGKALKRSSVLKRGRFVVTATAVPLPAPARGSRVVMTATLYNVFLTAKARPRNRPQLLKIVFRDYARYTPHHPEDPNQ